MIDPQTIKGIRESWETGEYTQREISEMYGVSPSYVSEVVNGKKRLEVFDSEDSLDLRSEIILLREEKAKLQKALKSAQKDHGLYVTMIDEIGRLVKPIEPQPLVVPSSKGKQSEHLVMHISDGHHDEVVYPEDCGGLETHNFDISCCRAEKYIQSVINWSQNYLADAFHFPTLTMLCYGDTTIGEIHGGAARNDLRNSMKGIFAIGQLYALMIADLAPYFKKVNCVCVPGNHGRKSPKKNYTDPTDSYDWAAYKVAEVHCQNLPNVEFLIPDSFCVNLAIEGHGFSVFHGDDVRSHQGIPWYGLERRQRNMLALGMQLEGKPIKYHVCGHFHRPGNIAVAGGEMLINGAWVGTDAYAFNSMAVYTAPTQLLHGVNDKHGISWRLPIHLKTPNEGIPKRYRIKR